MITSVVAGYGTSGAEAVAELIKRGAAPETIVVIDDRATALEIAEACGVAVMEGDATRNAVLEAAQVARASAVIVAAGRDDTSILIVLTARGLAPSVPISVVIKSQDNEAIARQAGANTVINPTSLAGVLLAGSTHGAHIASYIADLAAAEGQVALHEREVAANEIGHPLSQIRTGLGLRVYRGEQSIGFWEAAAQTLEGGDVIVEVVQHDIGSLPG